jgi:hypothetical protein
MNCATHNDVAAVAFCRTCGKALCNQCTRDVRGVIYCESCLAARMEGTAAPNPSAEGYTPVQTVYSTAYPGTGSTVPGATNSGPNPAVAGILAGFFPIGVGAVYTGQYAKGLAHLVIMVLLIIGLGSDLPWFVITMLAIGTGFFYIYQIIDSIRSAKAIQVGEPAPDPFGLAQTFGAGEKFEATKIPTGAAVLIGLGLLFLLHTAGLFQFGLDRFWPLILIALGVWLFAKQWGIAGVRSGICYCERCRTRKLMGPSILITLGVLFLLDSTSRVSFGRTWPALLLVIGVVKLMQSNASSEGHLMVQPRRGAVMPTMPNMTPPQAPPPSVPGVDPQTPSSGEVKNV